MKQPRTFSIPKDQKAPHPSLFVNSKTQSLLQIKKILNTFPRFEVNTNFKNDKNNSSSNIFVDYNNSKQTKLNTNKKDKSRFPTTKTKSTRLSKLSNHKFTSNNSIPNKQIKCTRGIFDFSNPAPLSFDPKYSESRNILKKNLEKIFQNKNHTQSVVRKQRAKNESIPYKFSSSESESPHSLSCSISAHDKLVIDNKEASLNKYFSNFFKKLSHKTVFSNNWKLSQLEDDNNNHKLPNILNGSSQLIDDIFQLVKVFSNNPSPSICTSSVLKGEMNPLRDSFYQKSDIVIHSKDDSGIESQQNSFTYILTYSAIKTFNTIHNLFSDNFPSSHHETLKTSISPITDFSFSQSVTKNFVGNLFFNETLEQVFNMNILFHFPSVESKVEVKLFNKIHTDFLKEVLNVSNIDIQTPNNHIRYASYDPTKYSYNEEFEMNMDLLSLSSQSEDSG